jgi:tryptophan synthase alpha chain
VIQLSSQAALAAGATPGGVLDAAAAAEVPVPLVPMTYYNPVLRMGLERFAGALAARGMSGAIIPDLPLEELDPWAEAADAAGVATVLLAPPSAPEDRLAEICRRSRGFIYGMSLMGVTGVRAGLAGTAAAVGDRLRALTDKPVMIGIGISDGDQAVAAARHCDGVIVGSAVVRRIVDGMPPAGIEDFVAGLRSALDRGFHQ